ncbi:MAG: response regulator [Holophagaceae bacterium]|nr:response regulator [Holophagaceae bacterium]
MTQNLGAVFRVLVIEDEEPLRASVIRGISKLTGVEVAGAGTLREALDEIDRTLPDFILSDIDLPDRSGLELVGELGLRSQRIPIAFVSGYVRAYRSQIPQRSDIDVLEKPVGIEDLRNLVRQRITAKHPVGGPFSLADYLQLACMGRHSLTLELRSVSATGRLLVKNGSPWSAADEEGKGLAAFRRLLRVPDAIITCTSVVDEEIPRDIDGNLEQLLLETALDMDNGLDAVSEPPRLPGSAPGPEPPPAAPAEDEFSTLWDDGVRALLAKDYDGAWNKFTACRELRPDDKSVNANLKLLEQIRARLKTGSM